MISSETPRGVDVGGVDQRCRRPPGTVELLVGTRLVGLLAEGHGAEGQGGDGAAAPAEGSVVHGAILTGRTGVANRTCRVFHPVTAATREEEHMRRTPLVAAVLSTALVLPLSVVDAASSAPARRTGDDPESSALRSAELSATTRLADRRSLVVGDRFYEMGAEDGSYPATGFHTRGEMGGFWTPPIKLLDGLWFKARRLVADVEQVHQRLGLPADGPRHPRRRPGHPHRLRTQRRPGRRGRAAAVVLDRADRDARRSTRTAS